MPLPPPTTTVRASLNAIARHSALNAFVSVAPESHLLAKAAAAEARIAAGSPLSDLDGRLIAIKDNICTPSPLRTTCASKILGNYTSPISATVVDRLEAAGMITLGKTNMDEFGMGSHSVFSSHGAVKNPHDSDLSTGGSSGGSAAAVAAGICDLALGTDTGGSIRLPSAYCSITGFKPSYGLLSRWGVVAYANSLDTVGILSRNWRDARSLFSLLSAAPDTLDPTSIPRPNPKIRSSSTLRIGIPVDYNLHELDDRVRSAWIRTLESLSNAGHEIIPISLPNTKHALAAYYVLAPAEASSNLARYDGLRYGLRSEQDRVNGTLFAGTRGEGFGEEVKKRILLGAFSLSAGKMDNYFIQAQKIRKMVQDDFTAVFGRDEGDASQVDVLIAPTSPSPPPKIAEVADAHGTDGYVADVLTTPASLAGIPSISLPVEKGVGMQVMAQWGGEEVLWKVAEGLEEAGGIYQLETSE
ncbi:amidase signature enzyme [Ascodesmis nigricans]|uniref:Glutamyl-tRNA(Gln) amidotransferase subunit A, mitochondrial n=1 Tax=Ascodesmis nigricans TaxID=341454 RepID=A0A4S2N186_9PEZI|nr:amidase signature enzyme [Ascodesmis nigricans]